MNFYWRQTIVGLLRYAAEQVPEVAARSLAAARELDRTLTTPWLEEAFAVFQDAALRSRNPVYVTGAFYSMRALEEVERWEEKAGGPIHVVMTEQGDRYALPGSPAILPAVPGPAPPSPEADAHDETDGRTGHRDREITEEAEQGIVELFERIRCGATLEEALALFPLVGDESSPE